MLAFIAGIISSCAIENDIPYPIVEASIESITVEGQRGADQNTFTVATINKSARTVTLYVNDGVDISHLQILSLKTNVGAELVVDNPDVCEDFSSQNFLHRDLLRWIVFLCRPIHVWILQIL